MDLDKIDDAIYCMKSYLPDSDYKSCTTCKYYGSKENLTCCSNEFHHMAIDIMEKYKKILEVIKIEV